MCGIAGAINAESYNLDLLKKALYHRGPDEQSSYIDKNVAFVHTRLSIQDIKHGQQPVHYGHYSIIFNGQIYNHLALRKEYLADFQFTTASDTQTLLCMYIKFGMRMFAHLDGMFAFAILDRDKNHLFLARDRAGKKPLYYSTINNTFIFASELNALKSVLPLNIDEQVILSTLHSGLTLPGCTTYKEIKNLTPGTCISVDLESLVINEHRYFNILDNYLKPKLSISFQESMDEVENALKAAVKNRLLSSDLEVGAFLSGGIDSGLIVAMASEIQPKLKTFTIKFPGDFDESAYAKLTADRYGTEHTEINIAMNVQDDLEKILLNYGQPFFDSSAIPSYYIARAAKEQVTVVLNGDGADELFGGYRRYVPMANHWLKYAAPFSWATRFLPKPDEKSSKYNYLYRLLSMSNKTDLEFYISATTDAFADYYQFSKNAYDVKLISLISKVLNNHALSSLEQMMYLDFELVFCQLLMKVDIATMAHALEARSPFISNTLLDLAPRLPDKYKVNGLKTKYILRELAKKYLPESISKLPKRGFEAPLQQWLSGPLSEKMHSYLDRHAKVSNYINPHFIESILGHKLNISNEKRAKILWQLLCMEIWLRNV